MLTKTKAIVLYAFKYGENQMIAELLTEACGRMACIMKIPKSPRGKLKKQYFQPLFILETVIEVRGTSRLQHIREARVSVPFTSIPVNPYKTPVALFVAELLRGITRGELTGGQTYTYIENSIRWLDGCTEGFANFHLVFMMRMTRFLGFYPNLDSDDGGSWFDLRSGCFCKQPPMHRDCITPHEARKIRLLLRMNFPTMHLYKMTHTDRNRMTDVIMSYYRIHIPDLYELKSLPVLRELFG